MPNEPTPPNSEIIPVPPEIIPEVKIEIPKPPDIPAIEKVNPKYICPNCQDEIEYSILKMWVVEDEFYSECNTCGKFIRLRVKDRPFLKDRLDRFQKS